jgi:hypothetical protein
MGDQELIYQNLLMDSDGNLTTALRMAAAELALAYKGISYGAIRRGHLGYATNKANSISIRATPPEAFDVDHTENPNG